MINKYDYFIFDLDGTIYRGNNIIPNAAETVNHLKKIGKKIIYISNKTTGSINEYFQFLSGFGLNIDKDEIINSTLVLKKFLSQNHHNETFFAIGEKVFIDEIEDAGLKYEENPSLVKIILITLDRTLNYDKLEIAAKALEKGARFYAANIDDTCPVDEGEVLDAGATISALEKRTHRKLEKHFGKPSQFMINEIKQRLGNDLSKVLLTGDRLETDITMGNNCGIDTALVSTGVKYFPNGNANVKPTYNIESVYDLIKNGLTD
jgi:HAD superfamily hydrolase (TIGR01450 family)